MNWLPQAIEIIHVCETTVFPRMYWTIIKIQACISRTVN
jgi:hypothetical protein